ncbi:MAG TPA: MarR family transcriptional regulator [Actinomycetes bacterium]|jgi:DNA-binding MarR family transcriptional regulator
MTSVKGLRRHQVPEGLAVPHVPMMASWLMEQVRDVLGHGDLGGLRGSHFRLLTSVPRGGINVTELAAAISMTKQAAGQFVTYLEGTGHLTTRPDPNDGRVRLVVRTQEGDHTVRAVNARIARLERRWAGEVGADRFETFKTVLHDLTVGRD